MSDERWNLFLEQQARLAEYVRRLVSRAEDTVDVVQEVGLELLRQPVVPPAPKDIERWCKAVARHVVSHQRRARRYENAKAEALDMLRQHSQDPWAPERLAGARVALRRELGHLDEGSRDLLVRRFVLEQTSQEIALELKLSPTGVRMRLRRLLTALDRARSVPRVPPEEPEPLPASAAAPRVVALGLRARGRRPRPS